MELNKYIDHTYLKAFGGEPVIRELCQEAKDHHFKSVCINPCNVQLAKELLKGSDVLVCTVIGFPLGQNTTETKVFETLNAINNGADEIDMVINVAKLKDQLDEEVYGEIALIKKACGKKTLKVIIETCYLNEEEIVRACQLSVKAKADFIKTSTGFGTAGATIENVKLMAKTVEGKVLVKAAGGINNYEDALSMVKAGASRLGTSHGVHIVEGEK